MASVIIQISKKTPSEELYDRLKVQSEDFSSHYPEFTSINYEKLLEETLSHLPSFLKCESALKEHFTLLGFVFSESLLPVIEALEKSDLASQSMQALGALYTVSSNAYHKFRVFKSITSLASKDQSLSTLLQPHFQKIDKFVTSWGSVPIDELSELIQSLLSFPISNNKKATLIFRLLTEGGLEGPDADQVIAKLVETTSEFHLENLLELPGFHKATPQVQELIRLLLTKSIQDVLVFWEKEQSLMKVKGFTKEKIIEAGRIAGIVKLALGNHKVTFSEIAERLGVSESEVDLWVVRAISGGLVHGKIDTIAKAVTFEHEKSLKTKKAVLGLIAELEDTLNSN
jgi:hypothetical protein